MTSVEENQDGTSDSRPGKEVSDEHHAEADAQVSAFRGRRPDDPRRRQRQLAEALSQSTDCRSPIVHRRSGHGCPPPENEPFLRPGDILLFHGHDFVSWAIRRLDESDVDRAAIVLRPETMADAIASGLRHVAIESAIDATPSRDPGGFWVDDVARRGERVGGSRSGGGSG